MLAPQRASAADAQRGFEAEQFHQSAWSAKEGAPPDIWALAQDVDGLLWLGTGAGLYKFDGVKFRHSGAGGPRAQSRNITALKSLPNGDLWIGYYTGGVSLLHGDRLEDFGANDGLPDGVIYGFTPDADGTIWAATQGGLAKLEDGRWKVVGPKSASSDFQTNALIVDAAGTLWTTAANSLISKPRGAATFADTGIAVRTGATLAFDLDGNLWASDNVGGTRVIRDSHGVRVAAAAPPVPSADELVVSKRLLFDREGRMWGTDKEHGGAYLVASPRTLADGHSIRRSELTQLFNKASGLMSDNAVPLLQDTEGDIWIGTNGGLNSLRRNNFDVLAPIDGVTEANLTLAVDPKGVVWTSSHNVLFRLENGVPVKAAEAEHRIAFLSSFEEGSVWMSSNRMLTRLDHGVTSVMALPPGVGSWDFNSIQPDRSGGIWITIDTDRPYHYANGRWESWDSGSPKSQAANFASVDPRGALWVAYADGRVLRSDDAGVVEYAEAAGLDVGMPIMLYTDTADAMVGGQLGFARFRDNRFCSVRRVGEHEITGVTGIVHADDRWWVNSQQGLLEIDDSSLDGLCVDPPSTPTYRLFDYRDGLPGTALQSMPGSTVFSDGGGGIWVATNQGIAHLDTRRIHRNLVEPAVSILSVSNGFADFAPVPNLHLPAHSANINIAYVAAGLAVPERVKFRYKLTGVDADWQEAGTRREAFYANLGPGHYEFRVIAGNEDDIWNSTGATLTFSIEPMFHQTLLFRILCGLLGALAVALLFVVRLRQLSNRVRGRLEERHAERERIARELHDTLLQSVHGLVLRFQAVAERIQPGEPTRQLLDKALDVADVVMIEGRDRVRGLRTPLSDGRDLSEAFASLGDEFSDGGAISFRVVVLGPPRPLKPLIQEEVYRIGREAVLNAFHHARATAIEVELSHEYDQFRVCFRDDGIGIDPAIVESGGKAGHWGLAGMRERTSSIGGAFAIWARPGSGTELELRLPAAAAYAGLRASLSSRVRRWIGGGRLP